MKSKTGKQHYSPVTKKWENCGAVKRACRYASSEHKLIDPAKVELTANREITPAPKATPTAAPTVTEPIRKERVESRSLFKDVMAHLFGRAKPKAIIAEKVPVESASEKKAAVDPVPKKPVSEKVSLFEHTEDGGFKVLAHDGLQEEPSWYPFGNYTSEEDARALHKADPYKKYQNGECGGLAGELWHRNPHVQEYYMLATDSDPEFGTHHFVELHDGSFVDSMGVWSREKLLAYWKTIDPSVRVSLFDEGDDIVPVKEPNHKVYNQPLFDAVEKAISKHIATVNK